MADITAKYIDEHRSGLHTPESWARAVGEQVFNASVAQLKGGSASTVTVDAQFTVQAFDPLGCVQVCAIINGVQVCYHVNI